MRELLDLDWDGGSATMSTLAGMLVDLRFDLPSGAFRPLAPALDLDDPSLPGHLRNLGGEFPCVPFGSAASAVASGWPSGAVDDPPHGYGADAEWTVLDPGPERIVLACTYPRSSPVRRLVRRLRPLPDGAVAIDLVVEARRPARLPIGMHPILRVPDLGALVIDVAFRSGFTYPVSVHRTSVTAPSTTFTALDAVPARDGGTIDLRRLPVGPPTEDVVLLTGAISPAKVRFEHAATDLVLEWDHDLLPSVLIWHSDRALTDSPWSSRYRGIGLEPVAAAFDLPVSVSVSVSSNPIERAGVATTVELDPDRPLELTVVLRAEPAAAPVAADQEGPDR